MPFPSPAFFRLMAKNQGWKLFVSFKERYAARETTQISALASLFSWQQYPKTVWASAVLRRPYWKKSTVKCPITGAYKETIFYVPSAPLTLLSQALGTTVWQSQVLQTERGYPAKQKEELQVWDGGEFCPGDFAGEKLWILFTKLNAPDIHL